MPRNIWLRNRVAASTRRIRRFTTTVPIEHPSMRFTERAEFREMFKNQEHFESFTRFMSMAVEVSGSLSEQSKEGAVARQRCYDEVKQICESSGVKEENIPPADELFSTENVYEVASRIDDPTKAPPEHQKGYERLKQMWEDVGSTCKQSLELLQKKAGVAPDATSEIKPGSKEFEYMSKRMSAWDVAMFLAKVGVVAGAFVGGYFLLEQYMKSITGCYRADKNSNIPPVNLSKTCPNQTDLRSACSCDSNKAADDTAADDTQLIKLCGSSSTAPQCYKTKKDFDSDVGTHNNWLHDYSWHAPNAVQAVVEVADTIARGLDGILQDLNGPLKIIIIVVVIALAVMLVIGFFWKVFPILNGRKTAPPPPPPPPPPTPLVQDNQNAQNPMQSYAASPISGQGLPQPQFVYYQVPQNQYSDGSNNNNVLLPAPPPYPYNSG